MVRFFRANFSKDARKINVTILAFAMCIGCCVGSCFALSAGDQLISMIRIAAVQQPGFVSLVSVTLLPFLFSAIAIYIHRSWLLFPIAFARCAMFSCIGSVVISAFGSTGWLARILFCFSDCLAMVLLCWLWILELVGRRYHIGRTLFFVHLSLLSFVYLDCRFISPFLVSLLS